MADTFVAIVTAEEARERDLRAIAAGTPSRTLMQNAGVAAADSIRRSFPDSICLGVEIHTGPGNNGGDGWVVAGELAGSGIPIRVIEVEAPRTPDAIAAKDAVTRANFAVAEGHVPIIVDALLGTGSNGAPGGRIGDAVKAINSARENGAAVVALDIPTGLDATSGAYTVSVIADRTLAFGTLKRGHLVSRGVCGGIEVLDIGLGQFGIPSGTNPRLASSDWVAETIPRLSPDAHKGTRKRLAIIAGDVGMAGAAILAGKGALRSGIGLLHVIAAHENRDAIHCAIPTALVSTHDELLSDAHGVLAAAAAIVLGPGLTRTTASRIIESLGELRVPILLDAGALSAFETDRAALARICETRNVLLTPHPAEMGRLMGIPAAEVLANRFEVGAMLAQESGATVLLKGTPTIISDVNGQRMVTATGTPALATGGSGDLLSGIIGTLLAQTEKAFESAVCGAWIHGRAAELCGSSRGITLEDILFAMPSAWKLPVPACAPGVLASLPVVQ